MGLYTQMGRRETAVIKSVSLMKVELKGSAGLVSKGLGKLIAECYANNKQVNRYAHSMFVER
jgi:hypothetical protein